MPFNQQTELLLGVVLTIGIAAVAAVVIVAYLIGSNHQRDWQDRRDEVTAERLRATVRQLDAGTGFVTIPFTSAESIQMQRCHCGPESCCCERCEADGTPPSP